jgi:SAM-dependent methyltransferase
MAEKYEKHFQGADRAAGYQAGEYAPGTYADLLWKIEQDQLGAIIADLRSTNPRIEALDFASGTGRITAFLEEHVDAVTGIEISESMCEIARGSVKRAKILCTNILSGDQPPEAKYDLITAFRFFLNAEPSLRRPALNALASRLRDKSSLLVINNHGNLWSHKLLLWPYHKIKRLAAGRGITGNYLRNNALTGLFRQAGLELISVSGCGFWSPKSIRLLGYDRALRWEGRCANLAAARPFCVNQMFAARLA